MTILTVGIDLAKNVFAVHGVNPYGKPELVKPAVARGKLPTLVAALQSHTISMDGLLGSRTPHAGTEIELAHTHACIELDRAVRHPTWLIHVHDPQLFGLHDGMKRAGALTLC